MPFFDGYGLDVVKPIPYHKVDGTTVPSAAPITSPSDVPIPEPTEYSKQIVQFEYDVPESKSPEPNLKMPDMVKLEESDIRRSGRRYRLTQ